MTEAGTPAPPADGSLRILMVGDVVGKPGIRMTCDSVAWIRRVLKADAIVVNAENAADGSGLRCKDYRRLVDAGIDFITLGDHAYRKREIMEVLEQADNIVRPANLPNNAPGKGTAIGKVKGVTVAVSSLLGRVFMKPVDCPFRAAEAELEKCPQDVTVHLFDCHAEATSDMQLFGRFLNGKASAVLGTHTHVATADEQILDKGTGFQCDVGMTGPFESILGRKIDAVMEATLDAVPTPFQVATADVRLNGTWVDVDSQSGRCLHIERLELREQVITDYNAEQSAQRKVL